MRLIVEADAEAAAARAALEIANACEAALDERKIALIALSGGRTPWRMIEKLRTCVLGWGDIHVAQVDERVVPPDDERRNLTRLEALLVREGPLPRDNLLDMPVCAADLAAAARSYQGILEAIGGAPLRFDIVQLGLGVDGHTASLVPGDPVLDVDRARRRGIGRVPGHPAHDADSRRVVARASAPVARHRRRTRLPRCGT